MKQAISIIEDRVNGLGVAEPEIQRQGQWKISVQLPGIENPQEALDVIGKTAVLEFYDTNQFGTAYATEAEALKAAGVDSAGKLPADKHLMHWPAEGGAATDSWFIVTSEPPLTGAALSGAQVGFDQNNQPKVDMQFKGDGATKFADLTRQDGEDGPDHRAEPAACHRARRHRPVGPAGAGAHRRRPRRDHRQVHPRRGQEPRPRAPDRRAAHRALQVVSAEHRRRHVGEGLAEPGPVRRRHRPAS